VSCFSISRRPRDRCVDERGFTLIEALVALTILGLLVVGSLEAFGAGLRAQRVADRHLEAVTLASARLHELAALPLDSLLRQPELRERPFAPPFGTYRWSATIRRLPGSSSLWAARVVVSWPEGQESLETVLYRHAEIIHHETGQIP
jgi:prepilin-type N-terminal cleavage/methylation domain-containing protein